MFDHRLGTILSLAKLRKMFAGQRGSGIFHARHSSQELRSAKFLKAVQPNEGGSPDESTISAVAKAVPASWGLEAQRRMLGVARSQQTFGTSDGICKSRARP
jgi:hypothetical protein